MTTALATAEQTALAAAATSQPSMSGPQKALLLLVSIDEAGATKILSHLSPEQVQRLRSASDQLPEVNPASILHVHREFIEAVRGGVPTSLKGSAAYLRRIAGKALGEGKVAELWVEEKPALGPMAAMAQLDPATAMALLQDEHPQTLAVIFSLFDTSCAGQFLVRFPLEKQCEIVRRMMRIKSIPEHVIQEIERQFSIEVAALADGHHRELPGSDQAGAILKRLEGEASEMLLEELSNLDGEVADKLRKSMFTFEDLVRLDSRGMQALMKEVTTDQLTLALKSASDDLKEKVFGNVSQRAAAMLRDELEMMGPVRLADVQTAQQAIVDVALQLERDGRFRIARAGGDDYV